MRMPSGEERAASSGPTLRSAMAAEYRARDMQSLNVATLLDDHWTNESNRLATRVAAFLGADADEIAFTRGTGEALALVAAGLDLAAGDEVITTTREHPAALSPWLMLARRRGVVVKQIELPAPMTHASVAESPLAVPPGLLRLSVGIENVEDLRADLESAFAASVS